MAIHYLADVRDKAEHEKLQKAVESYPEYPYAEWRRRHEETISGLQARGHAR